MEATLKRKIPTPYVIPGITKVSLFDEIVNAVCDYYGTTRQDVCRETRKREIVEPRQIIHTLLKSQTAMSLAAIGILIGNKDHATVLHSARACKMLYQTDKPYRERFNRILKTLGLYNNAMVNEMMEED